jgi:hypothetical protein
MSLRIALAGIVRNEAEYLLEWIAWHRSTGFTDFFITDNESDDGTLELLSRLERAGVVRLHQEPAGAGAQTRAYNAMLKYWGRSVDRIAFLDADEFLVATDGRRPVDHLEALLAPKNVGAIAVNWRLFGSSGHERRGEGLVVERFTRCAAEDDIPCRNIKTYAKTAAIARQRIHRCELKPGLRYCDVTGRDVEFARAGTWEPDPGGDATTAPVSSLLRVHHYAVKSLQEYVEKKRLRGDAMSGPRDRGMSYFQFLDRNDFECLAATPRIEDTKREIQKLNELISNR